MVFILGIDIPIIAFFSFVVISVTLVLFFALVTMLWKGGKLIKEAEEVVEDEEKIHHIKLHPKKVFEQVAKKEESWWEKHKKEVKAKESKLKKGPTLFQVWDSYWTARKNELFNQPKWTEHKDKVSKRKLVIVKKPEPVKPVVQVQKEKQPKKRINMFKVWTGYWNKQKKDLDEGMKPEDEEG